MNISDNSSCPWGSSDIDLRRKKLSLAEKTWLANSFISGKYSASDLLRKYNIFGSRLHKYVKKTLKGEPLYSKPGQPRKLDEQSLRALAQKYSGVADIDEDTLRSGIREEYRATLRRKFPRMPECLVRQHRALTNKTVKYYSGKVREYIQLGEQRGLATANTQEIASESVQTCSIM